jgi:hypothetical protein
MPKKSQKKAADTEKNAQHIAQEFRQFLRHGVGAHNVWHWFVLLVLGQFGMQMVMVVMQVPGREGGGGSESEWIEICQMALTQREEKEGGLGQYNQATRHNDFARFGNKNSEHEISLMLDPNVCLMRERISVSAILL